LTQRTWKDVVISLIQLKQTHRLAQGHRLGISQPRNFGL
jgi:hypothetical protein